MHTVCECQVSLLKHGSHVFPVFEDAELVRPLVRECSKRGSVPTYWRVRGGGDAYGSHSLPITPASSPFLAATTRDRAGRALVAGGRGSRASGEIDERASA